MKRFIAPFLISVLSALAVEVQWDYPQDRTDIVFNIYATTNYLKTNVGPVFDVGSMWASDDPTNWILLGYSTNVVMSWSTFRLIASTTNLFYRQPATNPCEFFQVKASNVVTHLESD